MNNLADQRTLSVEISTSIKGISAIEIMIGYIGVVAGLWFLYPNRKAGILFVGIFFMLSVYGLMYNYVNKSDYTK